MRSGRSAPCGLAVTSSAGGESSATFEVRSETKERHRVWLLFNHMAAPSARYGVSVAVNDTTVAPDAISDTTASWLCRDAEWKRVGGVVTLVPGPNRIRVFSPDSSRPLMPIVALRLDPAPR